MVAARMRRHPHWPRPRGVGRPGQSGDPSRQDVRRRPDLPDLLSWINLDIAWAQRYAVATLCRILHTFNEGRVASKKASLVWAKGHVDPQWSTLIQQALDDRGLGWDPHEPPRPGSVEQTLAFVEYVQRRVGVWRGSR